MPEVSDYESRLPTPEWPLPPEKGVQVGVATLPHKCIDHIQIFDEISLIEGGFETSYGVSEWMEQKAVISVPRYKTNKSYGTNFYDGRVHPVEYGDYTYRGISGSVISQKGGFLSGILYADPEFASQFTDQEYITGLETMDSNTRDYEIGSKLVRHGFRSCLQFGRILLNHHQTRKYLLEQWAKEKNAVRVIDTVFSRVEEQEQQLVLSFRIGGVLSRINHDPLVGGFFSQDTHSLRAKEISVGAAVLSHELSTGGDLYGILKVTRVVDIDKAQKALDVLAYNPTQFGLPALHTYRDILACIFGQNMRSLQMAQRDMTGASVAPNRDLGLPKDTDHTGLHYDHNFSWQSSDKFRYFAEPITDQYLDNAVDDMHHMMLYATYFPHFLPYIHAEQYVDRRSIRTAIVNAAQRIGFEPYY